MQAGPDLFSYRKYWAHSFDTAGQLPMYRAEMDDLGWDICDIILVADERTPNLETAIAEAR